MNNNNIPVNEKCGSDPDFRPLYFSESDRKVVQGKPDSTTGVFGAPVLDSVDLPTVVSALRLPSTYAPPVFGAGLDDAKVVSNCVIIGNQVSAPQVLSDGMTLVGANTLEGVTQPGQTIIGCRRPNSVCGQYTTIVGHGAGGISGDFCVAVGFDSMMSNPTGAAPRSTVAVGWGAGYMDAGSDCVYLGHSAGANGARFDHVTCIGTVSPTQSDSFFVKPIRYYVPSGTGTVPAPLHYIEATGEIVHAPPPKLRTVADRQDSDMPPSPGTWTPFPTPARLTVGMNRAGILQIFASIIMDTTHDPTDADADNLFVVRTIAVSVDGAIVPFSAVTGNQNGSKMGQANMNLCTQVNPDLNTGSHVVEIVYQTLPAEHLTSSYRMSGSLYITATWLD